MAGSEDLLLFLDAGIRTAQATPLISRSGVLVGMVSTHWREPHELSARELRSLDVLARLAADLIERSRVDDNLREALEQLQLVTENMPASVTRCSNDHRYLWVSRSYASWLGRAPEDIAGRPIQSVIGQEAYEIILPHIAKVLSGERAEYEVRIDYGGNGTRWVHAVYVPTTGADYKVDGWIAVVTDITNARRAQEESMVREKMQSLGTLASGIAHDFNNLLSGVLAQADLALAEYKAGSSPEEELKTIQNAAVRGSEIVRQLMIYAGKENEVAGLVDVSRVVKEMIELLRVSVSKHAKLASDLGHDLPAVPGSPAQLRQIVMNLVINASDAIGDRDGVIRVTTRHVRVDRTAVLSKGVSEGNYVQLEISDTGVGMSPETQASIFDPFFTTKSAGRGLGLAVVRGIVRTLRGAIQLASEPGRGTTFQVLLPCAEAPVETTADPIARAERAAHASGDR
jgi:PAS domain S-box-containing protein